jgi:uncharacterized protein (DUF1810 family)
MPNLARFKQAQATDYEKAHEEMVQGAKITHWIWYILPQLKLWDRLGGTAKYYGIEDVEEACEYLEDKELFDNYLNIVLLIEQHLTGGTSVDTLMGSEIDASKLSSSVTLFGLVAPYLKEQGKHENDYAELERCCSQILTKIKKCDTTASHVQFHLKQKVQAPTTQKVKPTTPSKLEKPQETTQNSFFVPPKEKPQILDYHSLVPKLNNYITTRKKEWDFHYNFLGLIAFAYFIMDAIKGTNHFNNKKRETKIKAAQQLKQLIENPHQENIPFTEPEKNALADGRLGALLTNYGGLDEVIKNIKNKQEPMDPEVHCN